MTEDVEPVRIEADPQVLGRAIEALIACADDLEAELRARYSDEVLQYPSEARRYYRDMQSVRDARNQQTLRRHGRADE